jgi:hypothetical protein
MSTIFLKVKIKSLAAEARIIRREENRCRPKTKTQWMDLPTQPLGLTVLRGLRRVKLKPGEEPREPFLQLCGHRIGELRSEARSAQLAYGFLRGRKYHQIERQSDEPPDMDRMMEIVKKFGTADRLDKFSEEYQLPKWQPGQQVNTILLLTLWMRDTCWPFKDDGRGHLWIEPRDRRWAIQQLQAERTKKNAQRRERRATCNPSAKSSRSPSPMP